jgi:hypothetical protein
MDKADTGIAKEIQSLVVPEHPDEGVPWLPTVLAQLSRVEVEGAAQGEKGAGGKATHPKIIRVGPGPVEEFIRNQGLASWFGAQRPVG